MKWFGKGEDPALPKNVDSERTLSSLSGFIDYHLQKESKDVEEDVEEDL